MSDHVLKVQDIDVFYGTSQALFNLSFEVNRGETLALLGRNGAGKSTTMKTIAGVNPTKKGSVELYGKVITGRSAHLIARAGIGYVPEDRQIFPDLSVDDNLTIAIKKGAKGEDDWSLERVYDTLPLLAPLKDRMGGQLSGGEQQMLTVGRALMGNPDVLLLDEPTNNLDPISREEILGALASYKGSVVLVSHDTGAVEALNPERVLILPDGVEDHWNKEYAELVELA